MTFQTDFAACTSTDEARELLKAAHQPCVTMIRLSDSANDGTPADWRIFKEDGGLLSVPSSNSQGLQEGVYYALANGFNFKQYGGGIKPQVFGALYGGALPTNPFGTSNGSNVVGVNHSGHGLVTGTHLTFEGLSGSVNGIPSSEIQGDKVITVVNPNTYTFTTTTAASSSGSSGGSNVRFQQIGQDVSIIGCCAPLILPPMQGASIEIQSTLNFTGNPSGVPAICLDSLMMCDIVFKGQVVCGSNYGIGLRVKPQNELPQDGAGPVVTDNFQLSFGTICMQGTNAVAIDLDATVAPISGNPFRFIEPNNTAGGTNIRSQVGAGSRFINNEIAVIGGHGSTVAGINNGVSSANAGNIYGNIWRATMNPNSGVGLEDYSWQDAFALSITGDEGTPSIGIRAPAGIPSSTPRYLVMRNSGTTGFANRS